MRRVLTPKWILFHAFAVVVVLACLRLGWWQWSRAESSSGTLQNLGYALEWPVFAAFAVFLWVKTVRDEIRNGRVAQGLAAPEEPATVVGVTARPEPASPDEPADPELAAYNAYLATLNARSGGAR